MAHIQDRGIIEQAARLHDIGMMGLPKRLLQKVEPLTADERARISTHAQRGGNSLISQYDTREVGYLVLHHHERIDGQGYPNGLKADAIPFGSRVIAVAEAFDAMTQHAAYHEGMNVADALKTLTDGAGKQWDQRIVVAFVRHCIPRLRQQHRLVVP
jgi:HD-GYP domain-containing protein (c-di-GMP phosphodiesterase class II)